MDPGILPGPTAMHPGTYIDHFFFGKCHQDNTLQVLLVVARSFHPCRSKRIQATGYSAALQCYCTSSGSNTGCLPTFMTESATGFGTNTGQDWALRCFFKLNLPTTNWRPKPIDIAVPFEGFFLLDSSCWQIGCSPTNTACSEFGFGSITGQLSFQVTCPYESQYDPYESYHAALSAPIERWKGQMRCDEVSVC